ncbi:Transcription factor, MADS-box [Penicillium camemberti]|uniref:Transcription factor, MADS-box n=1 Tax=Penicillium camemberti (strain FM 013) TaxID=1429867 RepID=A0A0G4PI57_PENC3|nr:Transcription factor, MADS-box [Penicillium camemberti]
MSQSVNGPLYPPYKDATSKRKKMRQKQCRRKTSLMKKGYEYSKMCSADVCVGISIRDTGQVHILSADSSGFWAFLGSQLNSYYPAPRPNTSDRPGSSG